MRDLTLIVRIRSDLNFMPAREQLRGAIEDGLTDIDASVLSLVSLAPVPRDRVVRRRKSPVRRTYPLLDYRDE